MKNIKSKASDLVDRYKDQLESNGIKIVLSKRYIETEVEERSRGYGNGGQVIFNIFARANDRKKEKEEGYNFENNKYHCIVMTVIPLDRTLIRVEECREYAFILKKIERAHLGLEPQKKIYQEEKVLAKMEKRILQLLKRTDKSSIQKTCKNTFWDACRYANSPKYEYKTKFCGKERFTWDMIFMFLAVTIAVVVLLITWIITEFV